MSAKNGQDRRICTVQATRLPSSAGAPVTESVKLAVETEALLYVDGELVRQFRCTPGNLEALALGHVVSSGMVADVARVADITVSSEDPPKIALQTAPDSDSYGDVTGDASVSHEHLIIGADALRQVTARLTAVQSIFPQTGGTHAAGLFGADGELAVFAEDVSRSNALDRVIGMALQEGLSLPRHGVALSGRVSSELVGKCARVGIGIIAAVSAPTSLAVTSAKEAGITLCGFVREGRATVFSHPWRIHGLSEESESQDER
ncbi:MAG: formate dehydrogenase accessory sulfurtransferase FdhD [Armatimonadota bacterium]